MLQAVLCGFSGVIINDEAVHQRLIEAALLGENLRPDPQEYTKACLGRNDRDCLISLLSRRGRVLKPADVTRLLEAKALGYRQWLDSLDKLPFYPGLEDLVFRVRAQQYPAALVTSAQRSEVDPVLQRGELQSVFSVLVTGESGATATKPGPEPYLAAIAQLNQQHSLSLTPASCVAIEDSFVGIQSAKTAGIPVIGIAHTYPNYMLQRRATWVVDYLSEIEFDWIGQRYDSSLSAAASGSI